MRVFQCAVALAGAGLAGSAGAQSTLDYPVGQREAYRVDSGLQANPGGVAAVVFQEVVHIDSAGWLRLYFGEGELEAGSFIRVTSVLDGETQELDSAGLEMWSFASAYFNGDAVLVQLVAGPNTENNRLQVTEVDRPRVVHMIGGAGHCGICGQDDRVPSDEDWSARLFPAGCTASIYNESSCLVSAGHCIGGNMVVQFRVPNSNGNCSTNNPPVADQFPIIQTDSVNAGVGNDWSVLIPGTNNLNQLPFDRYGALRPIASSPASVGQTGSIFGYGVDTPCVRSQTQQTADGPITQVNSNHYVYEIDLRGGNSGSALIVNNEIVGIITHCTNCCCPNFGTRVDLASFVAARDDLCGINLTFTFPDGLPELIDPDGSTTVRVVVSAGSDQPQPGTGQAFISVDGGAFVEQDMTENADNDYEADFPAADCGAAVEFYFSAGAVGGGEDFSPNLAQ